MNHGPRKKDNKIVIFFVFLLLCAGCSKKNKVTIFDSNTGKHDANWIIDHSAAFLSDTNKCVECHGSDNHGGISKVSCYSLSFNGTACHPTGPSGHPAGWADPNSHGVSAKAAYNTTTGFGACRKCHGQDFSGGKINKSCFTCHGVNAPHSPKPWRSSTRTHINTDINNASVCRDCHLNGANSTLKPNSAVPSDALPGCFNDTLCHAEVGHPDGFSSPLQHGVEAEQNFATCKICHGSDYKGGTVALISCYQCHNGPGINHPDSTWIIPDHRIEALSNIILCQKCHGNNYPGGGTAIACNSCHMENEEKVHPLSWYPDVQLNHRGYVRTKGTSICSNAYCHGIDLTGIAGSGLSCSTCHTWPIACNTCHKIPPSGSIYPDIAGSHSVHIAFANIDCSSCHTGAGSDTLKHMNNVVDVIISSEYKAKSGSPSFNSQNGTCVKVSCHGGQTTPGWTNSNIDVNTQCGLCHISGTSEYNSYFSGKHSKHIREGIGCTKCHDTGKLAINHFANLNTIAMTGASLTVINAANYSGNTCNPPCHDDENW